MQSQGPQAPALANSEGVAEPLTIALPEFETHAGKSNLERDSMQDSGSQPLLPTREAQRGLNTKDEIDAGLRRALFLPAIALGNWPGIRMRKKIF